MYCEKCGTKCVDTDLFCQKCGSSLTLQNDYARQPRSKPNANSTYSGIEASQNYNRPHETINSNAVQARSTPNANNTKKIKSDSYFDGNGFQYAGFRLLTTLIAIFTLGFGIPWANCLVIRWETRHTVINGKRLYFNGSAGQLFGKMILWELIIGGIVSTPILLAFLTSYNYRYGYLDMYRFSNWIPLLIIVDVFLLIFGNAFYYVYIKKWVISHTVFSDKKDNVNLALNSTSASKSNDVLSTNSITPNNAAQTTAKRHGANTFENTSQFNYENTVQQSQTKDNSNGIAADPYPLEYKKTEADSNDKYMAEELPSRDISSSSYNNPAYTEYTKDSFSTVGNTNNYESMEEKILCPVCSVEIPYGIGSCPNCGSEFRWD